MNSKRYFYHSFPRRKFGAEAEYERGISILRSIVDRGLLLTPEKFEFKESLSDGGSSKPVTVYQKRVCFTELSSSELPRHAKQFGEFALEFEIGTLRQMGGVPVFYAPLSTTGIEGVAAAMLARISEIQKILTRLQSLKTTIATTDELQLLQITRNGAAISQTRCTVAAAKDLMQVLEQDIQPIDTLLAAIRALSGYFYPVENLAHTGELAYYRQREWRVLANIIHLGRPVTQAPSEDEVSALVSLDPEFFGRELDFPTGKAKIATECQFYRSYLGKPGHRAVSRLIVPERAISKVESLLNEKGVALTVISLESLEAERKL